MVTELVLRTLRGLPCVDPLFTLFFRNGPQVRVKVSRFECPCPILCPFFYVTRSSVGRAPKPFSRSLPVYYLGPLSERYHYGWGGRRFESGRVAQQLTRLTESYMRNA